MPFVISVIPVVGDFAAAQQPVIVVLSEGTMLTVQAVVSDDRRFVRLTLVPFFSQIGEVQEFTFEGSETTSSSSASRPTTTRTATTRTSEEAEEITRSGTTVQLPTFQVISVTTTVSVPDGGTVLLGGIKRLREGRNEFGVPLLEQGAVRRPAVPQRGHRPRNRQPDDDGDAAHHHSGRRRRTAGRGDGVAVNASIRIAASLDRGRRLSRSIF